jgi:enoyl-CoA hydratase/carnithine racemase
MKTLKEVIVKKYPNFVHIFLNRPTFHNAIKKDTFRTIDTLFKIYEKDPKIKFVLMSGNGKSFCSGGDLVEITTAMTSNLIQSFNFVRNEYTLDRNLNHFSKVKPFIPIMDGYVMGTTSFHFSNF